MGRKRKKTGPRGMPYDASPRSLMRLRPAEWAAFAGKTARSVTLEDTDLSTVTASTDKVLRLETDSGPQLQLFDFQSGPDTTVPERVCMYNGIAVYRLGLPVESIVVLLHRRANLEAINGEYQRPLPGADKPYVVFRYRVMRLWEMSPEEVMAAGASVMPIAPLSNVADEAMPALIRQMEEAFAAEPEASVVGELWTATRIFLGLRYPDAGLVDQLLQGARAMKESSTYQAIKAEGEAEGEAKGKAKEARRVLLRLGEKRFKTPPSAAQQAAIKSLSDIDRLEVLLDRVLDAANWDDLLQP